METKIDKYDEVYKSMYEVIFMDYNDLLIAYVDDDKRIKTSTLGKEKVKRQKNRAKKGLTELKKSQRATFLLGCYEELYISLLMVVRPIIKDQSEFNDFSDRLRLVFDNEKIKMEKWILSK